MSYNKNTLISSEIGNTIKILDRLKVPYTLTDLGTVRGQGLNDDYEGIDSYKIRKLEYGDYVIIEQMRRTNDCDTDDYIVSEEFLKNKAPKEWDLEITITDS